MVAAERARRGPKADGSRSGDYSTIPTRREGSRGGRISRIGAATTDTSRLGQLEAGAIVKDGRDGKGEGVLRGHRSRTAVVRRGKALPGGWEGRMRSVF